MLHSISPGAILQLLEGNYRVWIMVSMIDIFHRVQAPFLHKEDSQ